MYAKTMNDVEVLDYVQKNSCFIGVILSSHQYNSICVCVCINVCSHYFFYQAKNALEEQKKRKKKKVRILNGR